MKLRQSNRTKRFEPPDYGLGPDNAPRANRADRADRADDSEDEFAAGAATRDGADKEQVAGGQSESGEDDYDENGDDDLDRLDRPGHPRASSVAKTKVTAISRSSHRSKRGRVENSEDGFSEAPLYPSDPGQRWTRTYIGPIKRWTRFYELVDWWFGDRPNRRPIMDAFLKLWWQHELIPPKLITKTHLRQSQNGWMGSDFAEKQQVLFHQLHDRGLRHRYRHQKSNRIDSTTAFSRSIPGQSELTVLLGHVTNQKQHRIHYGKAMALSEIGDPLSDADDADTITGGWLVDVAGIPISMAWIPTEGRADQFLAIAIIPFSDQAYYQNLEDAPKESSEQKEGAIHIFRFQSAEDRRGILRPSRRAPKLAHVLCGPWGRVSRIQWCPVQLTVHDKFRLLGVLRIDGKLGIIGVGHTLGKDNELIDEVEEPMIVLEPPKEFSLEITCFTWINMNRVAAGLSDGSVVVWSLVPLQILQRHPIHSTAIMDIVSGFPSDPYIISTVPIGGALTVTDLSRPTAETTYHPNMMVSLQPNLLTWSAHLRGYASLWPSAFAGNPNLTFLPIRGFPLCRHLITVTGQPTCITIGGCHPYMLAGTTDGSVWVFNILRKLSSHREKTLKVKLFQHEFRPPSSIDPKNDDNGNFRGMSRILQGFLPEPNTHPTGMKMAETQRQNRERCAKKSQSKKTNKGKAKSKTAAKAGSKASKQPEGEVDEETAMTSGPGPIVLYEPQTRITALAWNPNVEFGCWAAAAMGSGLVKIIDVGAEPQKKDDDDDDMPEEDEAEADHDMDTIYEGDEGDEDGDVEMAS
ncbi:hypothetical protein GGR50DRAFT_334445 [Xylaria sp. CBS 124048]|nr:hypothetical protein GGR50DRAFT_334445 [Xylaria sp. CBS 124048]